MIQSNFQADLSYLFRQYHSRLHSYISFVCSDPHLAEDITQEAFIRAQKSYHTFDPEKGHFLSWIKIIAKNHFIRSTERNIKYDFNSDRIQSEADTRISTEDYFVKKSIRDTLLKAVSGLPEPERSIVNYKYRDNLTLNEIAENINISRRNVSRKFSKALTLLRNELTDEDLF